MTLKEFRDLGGCEGCDYDYPPEPGAENRCMFPWFDEAAEDWEYSKNCDDKE